MRWCMRHFPQDVVRWTVSRLMVQYASERSLPEGWYWLTQQSRCIKEHARTFIIPFGISSDFVYLKPAAENSICFS